MSSSPSQHPGASSSFDPQAHPPVIPMPALQDWAGTLRSISRTGLELAPGLPGISKRFEAWWNHDLLDRPIFLGHANTDPARPITRRLDLLERPEDWLDAKLKDLLQLHRVGDELPNVRIDLGPVLLGGIFGGKLEFGANTGWTHPFIDDDWSNSPDWRLDPENRWWRLLQQLLALTAEQARGRFLVCTPDLGGSADVLLNLRSPQGLCLDFIDRPAELRAHIEAIYPVWHRVFSELYQATQTRGAGVFHWLTLWSERPYMIPASDTNYLIGPEAFQEVCLPDIARQAATVGRAVFHLDGPGAARHIDALLELPQLDAIQFTPGSQTPSALAWVEMFRKIQGAGKSILVICPSDEVLQLCEAVSPKGLAILHSGALTPGELDDLFRTLERRFGIANSKR